MRIHTLLGSCVAISLWHPRRLIGGMCHFMLPSRGTAAKGLDGRYASEALMLLAERIEGAGTRMTEYEAKLFGGASMLRAAGRCAVPPVGERNVLAGRELLARRGLRCAAEDVGGRGHRSLVFDLASGVVSVRRGPAEPTPMQCDDCEPRATCLAR